MQSNPVGNLPFGGKFQSWPDGRRVALAFMHRLGGTLLRGAARRPAALIGAPRAACLPRYPPALPTSLRASLAGSGVRSCMLPSQSLRSICCGPPTPTLLSARPLAIGALVQLGPAPPMAPPRRSQHSSAVFYRRPPKRRRAKTKGDPQKLKLKSHKGALKRFYQLADGTFIHKAIGKKHLQARKSRHRQTLRKRRYRVVKQPGIIRKLKKLLPYGTTMQLPPKHTTPLMWERPEGWAELAGFRGKR